MNSFSIQSLISSEFEEEITSSPQEVNNQHIARIFAFVKEKLFLQAIFTSMNPKTDMHLQ